MSTPFGHAVTLLIVNLLTLTLTPLGYMSTTSGCISPALGRISTELSHAFTELRHTFTALSHTSTQLALSISTFRDVSFVTFLGLPDDNHDEKRSFSDFENSGRTNRRTDGALL